MSKITLFKSLSLATSFLFLTSCSTFFPSPYPEVTSPKAYTIKGISYQPLKSAEGFVEEGIASWYGPGFHGKQTANGEIYNQNLYTAAHKILPLGTTVYVENLENGESISVRINDRGPFSGERIIDLSRKAAISLGMYEQGTARVRITAEDDSFIEKAFDYVTDIGNDAEEVKEFVNKMQSGVSSTFVESSSNVSYTPGNNDVTPRGEGHVYIYCGSYSSKSEAEQASEHLKNLGFPYEITQKGGSYYIETGPFPSKKDAENKLAVVRYKFPNAKVQ